jgi:hypothetical protein
MDGGTARNVWVSTTDIILAKEMELAEQLGRRSYYCPCMDCHGRKRVSLHGIKQHLATHRRDPYKMKSQFGGDSPKGYPKFGAWFIADDEDVNQGNGDGNQNNGFE